jgi:peptide/nickel transport system substrate-binding protein
MKRRILMGASLLGTAALMTPSLARSAGANVLKFVPQADLAITDPFRTTAFVIRNHGYLVYDTLYGTDENYRVSPQMVQGHSVEADGKVWNLTLRSGMTFHDGAPVLAKDVVASLKRWGSIDGFGQVLFEHTDEPSAESDLVVRFRLKQPFPLLPDALAKLPGYMPAIMPARIIEATPAGQMISEVIGSGPYSFVANERVQGSRFVYQRHQGYIPRPAGVASRTAGPKVAKVERVEWHVLPDQATAAAALQSGEVHWVESPSLDLLPLLRRNRHLSVELKDTTGNVGVMRLNHLTKPFDNPAIRRAVLQAVNQADFMAAVAGSEPNAWRDGVGFFCPDTPLAEGLPPILREADAANSKRALAEAGYRGEPVVLLAATDFPAINAMAQVGGAMLRQIGMNVDYQAIDWGTVQQRRISKEPVGSGGWSLFFTFVAGADTFNPAVHSYIRGNGAAGTPGWTESRPLEQQRNAWLSAQTLAEQKAACLEIHKLCQIDVPYIPLGQFFQPSAYRWNVRKILNGFPTFYNVELD